MPLSSHNNQPYLAVSGVLTPITPNFVGQPMYNNRHGYAEIWKKRVPGLESGGRRVKSVRACQLIKDLYQYSKYALPKKGKFSINGNEAEDSLAYVLGNYRGAHNPTVGTLRLNRNQSHLEGTSRCLIRHSDRFKTAQRP